MTVRELIEILQKQNPDHDVVLAMDPEGNGFDTAYDVCKGSYDSADREFCDDPDDPEQCNAVCIWP